MTDYMVDMKLPEMSIQEKILARKGVSQAILELTTRCNNDCRHCYINQPADSKHAKEHEMSFDQVTDVVDQLADSGVLWCLITGGEPLLRDDFADIYRYIYNKGLLIGLFTNAVLVNDETVHLLIQHPPRDMEVTLYGATEQTYEAISRKPGSFAAFRRGLDRLLAAGIKVRMKAVIMRSNIHEFQLMSDFCTQRTKDYYRFDPVLHLRYDRDPKRNADIIAERLTPDEIASLDRADEKRHASLLKDRDKYYMQPRFCSFPESGCNVFGCGAGVDQLVIGSDGSLRACQDLFYPDFVCKSRQGSIIADYRSIASKVRSLTSTSDAFRTSCHVCPLVNLCLWCPARAHLEHGELDKPVDYFCQVAHARARIFKDEDKQAIKV